MRHIAFKSRIFLIRFAKVFPFALCLIVLATYLDCIVALATSSFASIGDQITLNTPLAWWLANFYEYGIYSIAIATILAFAIETCKWNKLAVVYLAIQLAEKHYLSNVELYEEQIAAITIVNIIICTMITYNGLKMHFKGIFRRFLHQKGQLTT